MDIMTIVGFVLGAVVVAWGVLSSGIGDKLMDPHGIIIVMGGTLSAIIVNTSYTRFLAGIKAFIDIFYAPKIPALEEVVRMLVGMADTAQKQGGIMALSKYLEGKDLDGLESDVVSGSLMKRIEKTVLFARTTPEQKLLIVKILQDMGHTVAMTGDGVNDAPALKQADIGIVVSEASDVARETSDMILLDNNFNTVLAAVEEGRGIFDNLKKVLLYLLADSFAEVLLVVISLLLSWPLPLLAVQILWINLISDGFPYLALTVEPKEIGLLTRKPISKDVKILDKEMIWLIVVISVMAGIMTLGVFGWYYFILEKSLELSRTLAFTMLGLNSLFYVFSSRSLSKPIWKVNMFQNMWLIGGVMVGIVMFSVPNSSPAFW